MREPSQREISGVGEFPRRSVVLLGLFALYVLLLQTSHAGLRILGPGASHGMHRAWEGLHLVMAVLVLPLVLVLLLCRWFGRSPLRQWSAGTLLLFMGAALLLFYFVLMASAWLQETVLPLPSAVYALAMDGTHLLGRVFPWFPAGVLIAWGWARGRERMT